MIDRSMAEKIVEKVAASYQVSMMILNESGVSVGGNMEKAGGVWEPALQLISGMKEEILCEEQDSQGEYQRSISLPLRESEKPIGVLRVFGEPEIVPGEAQGLRLAVEAMMELEIWRRDDMKRYNRKEAFLGLLLNSGPYNQEEVHRYASALLLTEDLIRIPVLIDLKDKKDMAEALLKEFMESGGFGRQDLAKTGEDGAILLFQTVACSRKQFMQDYKYLMAETLASLLRRMRELDIRYSIYFGPAQFEFQCYCQAYVYCLWMQNHIKKEGSYYFYDYVTKYLESVAPIHEFHTIFAVLKKELGKKFIHQYMELMEVLIEKEYNLIKSSDVLHIHKNTLVYRLDKIREVLNMNPLVYNGDREFMECFYFYLKRMEKET